MRTNCPASASSSKLWHRPIEPSELIRTAYGIDAASIKKRAAELPGIVSIRLDSLFPDLPSTIYPEVGGLSEIRRATQQAIEGLDISRIKPGDSVNILASHSGFTLLGGKPYAEMLRSIKDALEKATGATDVRLRVGLGTRYKEADELIKRFCLDQYFQSRGKNKSIGIAPVDEGVAIKTEIGTLYGLKKAYDAKWIVHAHTTDNREVHIHRQLDRGLKAFAMSYARLETRSTYHLNMGPRAANFVARAIFQSPFVREKHAFSVFLLLSPTGIIGVDADTDLFALNGRVVLGSLKNYGKLLILLGEIDECIAILDASCPVPSVPAAGFIYASLVCAHQDLFDLDIALTASTWYSESLYGKDGQALLENLPCPNPALKMTIQNYALVGYPCEFYSKNIPTVIVGRKQAERFNLDPQNQNYTKYALIAEDLDGAVKFAKKVTGTDKILIFDGAQGGLNLSESLAGLLIGKSKVASQKVDRELLPKWKRQRGLIGAYESRG